MSRPTYQIENEYVLSLVEALYGAISRNLRAVKLSGATDREVTLHFLLEKETAEDREEIEDIVFEFEALLTNPLAIHVNVVTSVGADFQSLAALPGRGVYHRKEEGAS